MVQKQNRPGDFTGQQKAKLAKDHAEAVKDRESELSMMEAAETEAAQNRVTDYSAGTQPVILDDPDVVAEAERVLTEDVQVLDQEHVATRAQDAVLIRINADLENVTIGAGNNYTFREGEKYKVPAMVAQHLEEKGYVWH